MVADPKQDTDETLETMQKIFGKTNVYLKNEADGFMFFIVSNEFGSGFVHGSDAKKLNEHFDEQWAVSQPAISDMEDEQLRITVDK